jgi:hypothetical protein
MKLHTIIYSLTAGIGIGAAISIILGDNTAVGMPIGFAIGIGIAIFNTLKQKRAHNNEIQIK